MRASPAIAILVLAVGCAEPRGDDHDDPVGQDHVPNLTRFIALGDAGTGEADQLAVAQGIARVCQERGCDFAVDLGDLIYPSGVDSADDPQFETKFELPYAGLDFPFYMALGNHDNYGDAGGAGGYGLDYEAGNHMVDYAERTDRLSEKWRMPARHYTFTYPNVTFIVLDTNTLGFNDIPGSPNHSDEIRAQEAFAQQAVQDARTPWVFAMGHHPYASNGPHGDAGSYDGVPTNGDYSRTFFEEHLCGNIDAYFAGHDHNLQWLEPVASCDGMELVISGGGGAGTYDIEGSHAARFQLETHGFWWFEADATRLRGVAFDEDGEPLFDHTIEK
jgi:tartrate-resistant acid phosphatase type 5